MVKKYLNASDVRMKLNRTVIFYDGRPCYVETSPSESEGWSKIQLTPLSGKDRKKFEVEHDDEKVDTSAPTLGYLNYKSAAYYLTRIPSRVSNQGLRSDNIISNPGSLNWNYILSQEFGDCLLGKYPTLNSAENMMYSLAWSSVAISPNFAIGTKPDLTIGLYQNGNLIGKQVKTGKYVLDDFKGSSFTKKLLDKVGVIL